MLDQLQKIAANYLLKPYLKWYLKKPRIYKYSGVSFTIYPTVFHPAYFFSTQLLLKFLDKLELKNKFFCEVGAGSGVVSLKAFKKGANVTALEINEIAVKGLRENFASMKEIKTLQSDLFDAVFSKVFDVVLINPPYFFAPVKDNSSLAWNCGMNGEYFQKLFKQLPGFINQSSEIYMILADNCEIERIQNLAREYNFDFVKVLEQKIKWEKNYIFKLNYRTVENRSQ